MSDLANIINEAYQQRQQLTPNTVSPALKESILQTISLLDQGEIRVAEPSAEGWQVHQWVKKAIILYFAVNESQKYSEGYIDYFDKVPLKFSAKNLDVSQSGARVVPQATIRKGAFIAKNVILMPSYVNIGAFVDSGTMIDTWATVGSCAQVGKNVHISGGVGIGGVLEPLQANPTIIEDNCFIGARSEIAEGVIVEKDSVISMGVYLGQSSKIYDRQTGEIFYGRVPAGSVVVPGSLPAADGSHSVYSAIIVKKVDAKTRSKTNLNELLRNLD